MYSIGCGFPIEREPKGGSTLPVSDCRYGYRVRTPTLRNYQLDDARVLCNKMSSLSRRLLDRNHKINDVCNLAIRAVLPSTLVNRRRRKRRRIRVVDARPKSMFRRSKANDGNRRKATCRYAMRRVDRNTTRDTSNNHGRAKAVTEPSRTRQVAHDRTTH